MLNPQKIYSELTENILPFWINHSVDNENGGFYGRITNELYIDKEAPKGVILCSRILWTYSTAYRVLKNQEYLKMAERAYNYLLDYFWDKENSGVYWMVDYEGKPIDTKKQIYAEAFAIYALSEFYRATDNRNALEKAIEIFRAIEKYGYDIEDKGYFEAYSKEWKLLEDLRLSEKDMNEKKSMNTHLHVLEAYTNLYRVWKSEMLEEKLKELIEVTIQYIIDKKTYHFKLFFDEKWNSRSGVVSYGHDIEGSWLLYEAAEVLGNKNIINKVNHIAIYMAGATFKEGIDIDGGLLNEKHENGSLDKDKHWWPQAEAVVGFINAYELTGAEHFLKTAEKVWSFIEEKIVDKNNGEWFWMAPGDSKHSEMNKVDPWKCPYHNSRACFEALERLEKINHTRRQ